MGVKDYDFKPSQVNQQNIWRSVATFSEREQDYPAMNRILNQRGFSQELLGTYKLFPAATDKGPGVGLPLYLYGDICGYQHYHPEEEQRYRTHGKRGIAGTAWVDGHRILSEGMFDCFALYRALVWQHPTVAVSCLVGNILTSEQLHYLLTISSHGTTFYLALDNDRRSEILRMHHQIAPYRKVKEATPPVRYGKDWDQAFYNYPKGALQWWKEKLSGTSKCS